jgi:hypothetical protein
VKTEIKRSHKRQNSQSEISKETHFQEIDSKFKTNEGLVACFISGGQIVSAPEGTTAMEVDESFFDEIQSTDPSVQTKGQLKLIENMIECNFHYQLRHAISQIYFPNDLIAIHGKKIEIGNNSIFTLYEIFCVVSCLCAIADNVRYLSAFSKLGNFLGIKNIIIESLKIDHPALSDDELQKACADVIANQFTELQKDAAFFNYFGQEDLLYNLKMVGELKEKTDFDLITIIDYLCSLDNDLSYNFIYKYGGRYYFPFKAFINCDVNRVVYDDFISSQLFNIKTSDQKDVDIEHKNREKEFNESIKSCLRKMTLFVDANIEYPKSNDEYYTEQDGEFDVLAYFENENLLFAIQVKLSNTEKKKEKNRRKWVSDKLQDECIQQVAKDSKFLATSNGLDFVCTKFGIERAIFDPYVYHLIVTDNFYADHHAFEFGEDGETVLCISYFELTNLISDSLVNDKQIIWESHQKSGIQLASLINSNVFWSFLSESQIKFSRDLKLQMINPPNSIRFVM